MNIHPSWLHHDHKPLHVCSECRAAFPARRRTHVTCSQACRKKRRKRLARKPSYCVWQANPSTPVDMNDVKARMPRWLQELEAARKAGKP